MQKETTCRPSRWLHPNMLYPLLLITIFTVTIITSQVFYPYYNSFPSIITTHDKIVIPYSLHNQIINLQTQLGTLLQHLRTENPDCISPTKFTDQLLSIAVSLDRFTDILSNIYSRPSVSLNETSNLDVDFTENEDGEQEEEQSLHERIFNSRELQNYTSPKINRQGGKKNFLGVEAVYPSVGLSCVTSASNIERYLNYKLYRTCPDDWIVAQKLMVSGCDPLPRRRCFSMSPKKYSKPFPTRTSLWSLPSDSNILWTHYKCKDYSCLISNKTVGHRGFFKCADCFDFNIRGWEIPANESISAEFTIDQVLKLKSGEIRIGLDFSPTTGTFAAIMRERNITIATATMNLGAPFNEVIALRGLLPLYVSIGSRLPFFDNTLDIVHSTLFLDGWIGLEVLEYVLFDWDRVLRPKGILWIDRFFCSEEDMKLYLETISKLGYKKLLWRLVPKTDKTRSELFLSAVLEKPLRD